MAMIRATNNICPRCGGLVPNGYTPGAYIGATSRWDDQTEICSDCGLEEALLDMAHGRYSRGEQRHYLAPTNPERPWRSKPVKVAGE